MQDYQQWVSAWRIIFGVAWACFHRGGLLSFLGQPNSLFVVKGDTGGFLVKTMVPAWLVPRTGIFNPGSLKGIGSPGNLGPGREKTPWSCFVKAPVVAQGHISEGFTWPHRGWGVGVPTGCGRGSQRG